MHNTAPTDQIKVIFNGGRNSKQVLDIDLTKTEVSVVRVLTVIIEEKVNKCLRWTTFTGARRKTCKQKTRVARLRVQYARHGRDLVWKTTLSLPA